MTSLERPTTPPPDGLEEAFAYHLQRGAVDIVEDEASGDLEIHADAWTLALQGLPPTVAFFAIDDEPADESVLAATLDNVLDALDMDALRRLDAQMTGGLRAALRNCGDPLSEALAIRIDRTAPPG
jgi:hypothetical protein